MSTVVVLGTGLQGKAALHDISQSSLVSEVVAADYDYEQLQDFVGTLSSEKVRATKLDASNEASVEKLLKSADVVIELLPGHFSLPIAKLAVRNGVSLVNAMYLVDPSKGETPEKEALIDEVKRLDEEAKAHKVTILPEFGLDPGIDLVLCGQAIRELDETHELYSYGAGFPEAEAADNPLRYKVAWSLDGVLKSYCRPGRVLHRGHVVTVPGESIFSEEFTHTINVEPFGDLEAFINGDALRYAEELGIDETVRTAGRFALRWPGHCEFWKKISALGFLSEKPIQVGNKQVIPSQFLRELLEPQLHYEDDERDVALILTDARGIKSDKRKRVLYKMIDRRDLNTGFTAMTRTVGFAASIGAQMILRGDISTSGVLKPSNDVPFDALVEELANRGIHVEHSILPWEEDTISPW